MTEINETRRVRASKQITIETEAEYPMMSERKQLVHNMNSIESN